MDGVSFSRLATIDSDGLTTPKLMNYLDEKPLDDQTYYRLACVYFEGTIQYSKVILLSHLSNDELNSPRIFPNPVSSVLHIQWQDPLESTVQISLLNVHGQSVKQFDVSEQGVTEVKLALNDIPKGMYIVKLVSDHGVFKNQVVVH